MIRLLITLALFSLPNAEAQTVQLLREIRGQVFDGSGRPLPGPMTVQILQCSDSNFPVDDGGLFVAKCEHSLPVGHFLTLVVDKRGWELVNTEILKTQLDPPDHPLRIIMRPEAHTHLDASSHPDVSGLQISFSFEPGASSPTLQFRAYNPGTTVWVEDLRFSIDEVIEVEHPIGPIPVHPPEDLGEHDVLLPMTASNVAYHVAQAIDQSHELNISISLKDVSTRGDRDTIYRAHAETTWRRKSAEHRMEYKDSLVFLVPGRRNPNKSVTLDEPLTEEMMAGNRRKVEALCTASALCAPGVTTLRQAMISFVPHNVNGGLTFSKALESGTPDTVRVFLVAGADLDNPFSCTSNPLIEAARSANWEVARFLLNSGARVDRIPCGDSGKDGREQQGYHLDVGGEVSELAAVKGETGVLNLLFDAGVPATRALLAGALNHKNDVVQLALERGVSPSDADEALCGAVAQGFDDLITLLLKHGAPAQARECAKGSANETLVERAIWFGRITSLKTLLREAPGRNGVTDPVALGHVIEEQISEYRSSVARALESETRPPGPEALGGLEQTVQILLDGGADVRSIPGPLLTLTPNLIRMLARFGANININNGEPLRSAVSYDPRIPSSEVIKGNSEKLHTLLDLGVGKARVSLASVTAWSLHEASHTSFDKSHQFDLLSSDASRVEYTSLLLQAGADPNEKFGSANWTLLMWAANCRLPKLAEFLIESGADVNAKSDTGESALSLAIEGTNLARDTSLCYSYPRYPESQIVKRLVRAGANLNLQMPFSGETPLTWYSGNNDPDTVKLLLSAGADPKVQNRAGQSPLQSTDDSRVRKILQQATH